MDGLEYLLDKPVHLLEVSEGRKALTKADPLLFALVYLPDVLKGPEGNITLSEFHLDLVEYGKTWIPPVQRPKQYRDAFIAPRECGKTSWLFLILPIWAAAHGHIKFIAAYSDSANQAQNHLQTFKRELATNELLQADFPELCRTEAGTQGRALADNSFKTVRDNGFVFTASGVDVSNHGLKHGNLRPQLIILDDVEPGEANYSAYQAKQRLSTIWDDIAPQNIYARVVIVGTTTMPNSVIDQLRKYGELVGAQTYGAANTAGDTEIPQELAWIPGQNVRVHYYPALMQNDDGTERSVWPEKWSVEWLQAERERPNNGDFLKNYMNRPVSSDGTYWTPADVTIKTAAEYGNTLVSVDPAITRNKTSDYAGIAVLSRGPDGIYVRHARQYKMSPHDLADEVKRLVETFGAGLVYVEVNQGGDLWKDVFADSGARYRSVHQHLSKQVRAGKALNFYQQGKVFHTEAFPVLHEQMMAFPKVAHDDVIDAVVAGVNYFLDGPQGVAVQAKQLTYMA